jgi:hypothetical protein
MTIIQPTKPPDITPDKWTSEIWHYILKFLQPLDASFLFYSAINGAESLDADARGSLSDQDQGPPHCLWHARYPRAGTLRFFGFRLGRRPGQLPQHWRLHLLLGRRSLFMEGQTQQHCALKFSRKRVRRGI